MRKKRKHGEFSLDTIDYEGVEFAAPEDTLNTMLKMMEKERLHHCLAKLTDVQRRRVMRYAEGYTYREIAERENVSTSAVEESVKAALRTLKKLLTEEE